MANSALAHKQPEMTSTKPNLLSLDQVKAQHGFAAAGFADDGDEAVAAGALPHGLLAMALIGSAKYVLDGLHVVFERVFEKFEVFFCFRGKHHGLHWFDS